MYKLVPEEIYKRLIFLERWPFYTLRQAGSNATIKQIKHHTQVLLHERDQVFLFSTHTCLTSFYKLHLINRSLLLFEASFFQKMILRNV